MASLNEKDESFAEVIPNLFIGDRKFAKNKDKLMSLGIRYIVNVTNPPAEGGLHNFFEADKDCDFRYMRCAVADSDGADISRFFNSSYRFVHSSLSSGYGVLVHCQQGVSRSACLVLAYLMRARRMQLKDAYVFLKQRRSEVKPNGNFLRQLIEFEPRALASSVTPDVEDEAASSSTATVANKRSFSESSENTSSSAAASESSEPSATTPPSECPSDSSSPQTPSSESNASSSPIDSSSSTSSTSSSALPPLPPSRASASHTPNTNIESSSSSQSSDAAANKKPKLGPSREPAPAPGTEASSSNSVKNIGPSREPSPNPAVPVKKVVGPARPPLASVFN